MNDYSNWTPTSENINKLPKPIFKYIHGLESLCDPAYIIMENTLLEDQTKMLDSYIARLKEGFILLRRVADRGLKRAQENGHSEYVDIFQHILDEIERVK